MIVKEILFKRHIAQDELWSCCGVEVQLINYVLFECELIKGVWEDKKHATMLEVAHVGSEMTKQTWWIARWGKVK